MPECYDTLGSKVATEAPDSFGFLAGDAQCAATLDAEADQGRHTALLQTVATQRILGPDQPSTSQMLSTIIHFPSSIIHYHHEPSPLSFNHQHSASS